MAKKKKQTGHFCRVCHQYKANEKFSGKGHAKHICKVCQSTPASKRKEQEAAFMNTFEVIYRDEEPEELIELPFAPEEDSLADMDKDFRMDLSQDIEEYLTEWIISKGAAPNEKQQQKFLNMICKEYANVFITPLKQDDALKNFYKEILTRVMRELEEDGLLDEPENDILQT